MPILPSIISEGPKILAPASACTKACFSSAISVSSFIILPLRTIPSCPSELYGSSATSNIIPISGTATLIALVARFTKLLGLNASVHSEFFRFFSV